MTDWKKMLLGTTVALSLFAAPAVAQEIGAWDGDADGVISQEEFGTGFGETGAFGEWDANDDEALSEDEFNAGVGENKDEFGTRFGENAYSEWDEDGDGALTEDEFGSGVYSGYDADESEGIEEPEFGDVGDDMGDGGFWDV